MIVILDINFHNDVNIRPTIKSIDIPALGKYEYWEDHDGGYWQAEDNVDNFNTNDYHMTSLVQFAEQLRSFIIEAIEALYSSSGGSGYIEKEEYVQKHLKELGLL